MWLLETKLKERIEKAITVGFTPSAEQKVEFAEYNAAVQILTSKQTTAIINIEGVLTQNPNILAMIFGGGNTTYKDILASLQKVMADDKIDNVQLNIDSPGGEVSGLFDVLDMLKSVSKPIVAKVSGMAASAAYAIAAQADSIIASNRATMTGSVGVVAGIYIDDSVIEITSTNAPDKRPDVTTEEGKAVVLKEIDAIETLFIEAIADGRGTTVKDVAKNFGRGAILLADEAKERGMLDSIAGLPAVGNLKDNNDKKGAEMMGIEEFKATHPDTFRSALATGIEQERDRAIAHLTMGEASGDMQTAITAIRDGSGMTVALQAKYMSAGMNRTDQKKRVEDNPENFAAKVEPEKGTAEKVVEALEARNKS